MARPIAQAWLVVVVLSLGIARGVVGSFPAPVSLRGVVLGWGVAAASSLLAMAFSSRAVGRARLAFLGWGVGANLFRLLTLLLIFAYIAVRHESIRLSFLTAAFTGFFMLLVVEIAYLLVLQDRVRDHVERDATDKRRTGG